MISLSKKVCLLGDFAVGKTSLVRRFVYDKFEDKYLSTIGVKVSRKTVSLARQTDIVELSMMLWDLAGSEDLTRMRTTYLRGAAGALLVCDAARPETLPSLRRYQQDLEQVNGPCQVVIAANKADLLVALGGDAGTQFESEARGLAAELGAPIYFTSAVDGRAVEDAFRHLGRLLAG